MASPANAIQGSAAEHNHQIVDNIGKFSEIQSIRPSFDHSKKPIEITKHPNPNWQYGDGVEGHDLKNHHVEVDPYAPDRPMSSNDRLLISGITPRPISSVSTLSEDGTKNLAPMSYFRVVDHDPSMFVVGLSARSGRVKDTYRNLKDIGECAINTVSEEMIEAVNATSLDAPCGVSEWDIAVTPVLNQWRGGLTEVAQRDKSTCSCES
jgi:hypothetical protein